MGYAQSVCSALFVAVTTPSPLEDELAKIHFWDSSNRPTWVPIGPDQPEVLIGRRKDCTIRTENSAVSRLHCRVVYNGGLYLLEDQQSANGTFIDEKRVSRVELADNTSFKCGDFELRFELDEHERAALQRASIVFHQDPSDDEYVEINDAPKIVGKPASPTTADYSDGRSPDVASHFGPSSLHDYVNQHRVPVAPSHGTGVMDEVIDADDDLVEIDAVPEEVEQSVSALTAEVQRLKTRLREAEDQIDMRNVELSSLNNTLEDMRFVDEELDKAKETIAQLQATLAARPGEAMELAARVTELEANLAEVNDAHAHKLAEDAERIAELEAQLIRVSEAGEIEDLRQEVEQLRHELAHGEHAEILDRLKLERDRLSTDQERLLGERDSLEAQVNALNDQLVQALEHNELLRSDLDDEREARAEDAQALQETWARKEGDLRRDLEGARLDIARLTAENEQLKTVTREFRERLSAESETLTHKVRDLETQLHDTKTALDEVTDERDALKAAVDHTVTDLARAQVEHEEASAVVNELRAELESRSAAADAAQRSANEAVQNNKQMEAQLMAATEQLSRLASEHKLLQQEMERHDDDAAALRDSLERVRRELADAPDKGVTEKLRADYEKLEREHVRSTQHEEALKTQLAEAQRLLDEQKKQSAAGKVLQEALVKAKTELQHSQKQNEELIAKLKQFEAATVATKASVEENTRLVAENGKLAERLKSVSQEIQDAKERELRLTKDLEVTKAALADIEKRQATESVRFQHELDTARQAVAAAVTAQASAQDNAQMTAELESLRARLADTEHKLKAVTAEYETIKQAHTTQVRRYGQLLEQLKGVKAGDLQPGAPLPDPELQIWKDKADKAQLEAQKATSDLHSVKQQLATLSAEKGRNAAEIADLISERDALRADFNQQVNELAATREKLDELARSLAKLNETQNTSVVVAPAAGGNDVLIRTVKDLYQRMNDLASAWKNSMFEMADYLAELKERSGESEPVEMMETSVANCKDTVDEMKNVLRDFRTTLDNVSP